MAEHDPNPLAPNDAATEQRIRERAYHLWESDGRPHGRDADYWEQAELLTRMETHPNATLLPNPGTEPGPVRGEEAFIQENLGEFPDRFADQGERQPTPRAKRK